MPVFENKDTYLILDTGATNHMTCKLYWLSNFKHVSSRVQLLDDSAYVVHGVGNLKLSKNRILKNVMYLPEFKYNLLSIAKLTQDVACYVSFYPKMMIIHDLYNGTVLEIGRETQRLYVFNTNFQRLIALNTSILLYPHLVLWHK